MPCKVCSIIIAVLHINKFNCENIQASQNRLTYCVISTNAQKKSRKEHLNIPTTSHNGAVGYAYWKPWGGGNLQIHSIHSKKFLYSNFFLITYFNVYKYSFGSNWKNRCIMLPWPNIPTWLDDAYREEKAKIYNSQVYILNHLSSNSFSFSKTKVYLMLQTFRTMSTHEIFK